MQLLLDGTYWTIYPSCHWYPDIDYLHKQWEGCMIPAWSAFWLTRHNGRWRRNSLCLSVVFSPIPVHHVSCLVLSCLVLSLSCDCHVTLMNQSQPSCCASSWGLHSPIFIKAHILFFPQTNVIQIQNLNFISSSSRQLQELFNYHPSMIRGKT